MSKQKFIGEYPINASRKMLFPYLSTVEVDGLGLVVNENLIARYNFSISILVFISEINIFFY